jgi:hypothetical protein
VQAEVGKMAGGSRKNAGGTAGEWKDEITGRSCVDTLVEAVFCVLFVCLCPNL